MTDTTTQSNDVAARIREKIRLQALDLLEKVDSVEKRRVSRTLSGVSHHTASSTTTPIPSRSPSSLNVIGLDTSSYHQQQLPYQYNDVSQQHQQKQQRQQNDYSNTGSDNDDDYDDSNESASSNVRASLPSPNTIISTTPINNSSSLTSLTSSTATTTTSSASSSLELTKRLQKLAFERQKLYTDNKFQRLKVIQADKTSHLSSVKNFQDLNIPQPILDAIYNMGFDRPSSIQEEALPRILAKHNLLGQAPSGSGKTAAFTLGMLVHTVIDEPATCQAICVTPTRELAIQIVDKSIKPMACNLPGLKIQLAISQSTIANKKKGLDAHIVVGTPGKIVDWLKRKIINPTTCKVFVLDEADHMVIEDGGHRANSLLIQKSLPLSCQSLLFSATFPPDVIAFVTKMMGTQSNKFDSILIEDGNKPESLVLDVIKQLWVDTRTYTGTKLEFLADIYSLLTIGQSIVFVGRKDEADLVHQTLSSSGYTCSVLHSRVEAEQRDETMEQFRNGQSNVLITTNVLARGVDVDNVCLVVNYDVPVDKDGQPAYETYLHRIGRTGRFGRKGTAITLIDDDESLEILRNIEKHFTSADTANPSGKSMIQHVLADPEALADMIEI